jgi:hypothetical protein
MTTRTTTTPDQVRPADAPRPLVVLALQVLMEEPGRRPLGKIVDDLALDFPRPVAAASVRVAALLR